jgi:hypothetical protein
MSVVLRILLLVAPTFLCGCSITKPALKAVSVRSVPYPNGRIETGIWGKAPEIIVNAQRGRGRMHESRKVKLRAIHDGQALSILATWMDLNESVDRQNWIWNEAKRDYDLWVYSVDQCSIQWPLSDNPSFCMLGDNEEKYDLWTWKAGWTNYSGYAEDQAVEIHPRPLGTKADAVKGSLYPGSSGKGLVEVIIIPDSGVAASRTHPKPTKKAEPRSRAVASDTPKGSAGDVQAYGVYSPAIEAMTNPDQQVEDGRTPGYWYKEYLGRYRESSWFVEFYRLFATATPTEDFQITLKGDNTFALAIHDQSDGGEHYTTGPIRLKLMKLESF